MNHKACRDLVSQKIKHLRKTLANYSKDMSNEQAHRELEKELNVIFHESEDSKFVIFEGLCINDIRIESVDNNEVHLSISLDFYPHCIHGRLSKGMALGSVSQNNVLYELYLENLDPVAIRVDCGDWNSIGFSDSTSPIIGEGLRRLDYLKSL